MEPRRKKDRRRTVLNLELLEGRSLLSGLAPTAEVRHVHGASRSAVSKWTTAGHRVEAGRKLLSTPTFAAPGVGRAATATGIRVGGGSLPRAGMIGIAGTASEAALRSRAARQGPGFVGGAAGAPYYRQFAPPRIRSGAQLNQPLGQARADKLARALGLDKRFCFTEEQYLTFITGQGKNGSGEPACAKLVDESVAILTNSNANPMIRVVDGKPTRIVLGSYGVFVDSAGMLESPANLDAPTRQVNSVIAPGGYLSTWAAANGAERSLRMLYRSAYLIQLPHGIAAQHENGVAQLAPYFDGRRSAVTGLSMVPSIWEINFMLIYTLNPKVAAMMPAYWAPIPWPVVAALEQSPTGQVPFADYASYFK